MEIFLNFTFINNDNYCQKYSQSFYRFYLICIVIQEQTPSIQIIYVVFKIFHLRHFCIKRKDITESVYQLRLIPAYRVWWLPNRNVTSKCASNPKVSAILYQQQRYLINQKSWPDDHFIIYFIFKYCAQELKMLPFRKDCRELRQVW